MAVLHNDVLRFYQKLDLPVQAILTDNGREFMRHRAASLQALPGAQRYRAQKTRVGSPKTNGFVERFHGTVLEAFLRRKMRSRIYESVEALEDRTRRLAAPLQPRAPHLGYRNPWETVERFVSQSAASQEG